MKLCQQCIFLIYKNLYVVSCMFFCQNSSLSRTVFVIDISQMIAWFVCTASYSQYKSEDGRGSSATRPGSSGSGQTYTPTLTPTPTTTPTPSHATTSNSPSNVAATKTGHSCQRTEKRNNTGFNKLWSSLF